MNNAPILIPIAPQLSPITEDEIDNQGQTVGSIIGWSVIDPDGPGLPRGIAITGATASNGHWEFSVNGGTTWISFGTYSTISALLLDESSRVRFVPNGEVGGTGSFTYVGWDQTITIGGTTGVAPGGGSTPFSIASDTAQIVATAVNDAPQLAGVATSASYTEHGAAIALAPGFSVSDVDSDTLASASVTIAGGLRAGDVLAVNGAASGTLNGISWIYNATTGVLSFTGIGTKAEYQALLQQVEFLSTSDDPTNRGASPMRSIA